jgi:hypothetical protein
MTDYQRTLILSTLPNTGIIFTWYDHKVYLEAFDEHSTVKIITDPNKFKFFSENLHSSGEYILCEDTDGEKLGSVLVAYPRVWWYNNKYRIRVLHIFTLEEWQTFSNNLNILNGMLKWKVT